MKSILFFVLLLISNVVASQYGYVNVEGGIDVHDTIGDKFIYTEHLNFGDKLFILDTTDLTGTIKLNGKKTVFHWLKVKREVEDYTVWYLPDVYLHVSEYEIPPHTLYLNYGFSTKNLYVENYEETEYENWFDNKLRTLNYDYYANNKYEPRIRFNEIEIYLDNNSLEDTIKKYIGLEIINDPKILNRKIKNKFDLDTVFTGRRMVLDSMRNGFVLPVKKGKDSVVIEDYIGSESLCFYFYSGKIKPLNKYVIQGIFETPLNFIVDIDTGGRRNFTEGIPYISPDGKFIVDFYESDIFSPFDMCQLTISKLNKKFQQDFLFSIGFKSWMPDTTPLSAFWISNHELVIRVYALKNKIHPDENTANYDVENYHYQYIKLTIKE